MTDIRNRDWLPTLTIFLLGAAFSALLMYYAALSKGLDGLYNDSIFLNAAYFGCMAALTLSTHYALTWWRSRGVTE